MSASPAHTTRALFGAAFIVIAETAILADWTRLSTWATPICWWGYLLLLDAWVESRTGRSPFTGRPARFFLWTLLSVVFWLIFEAYNLRLRNWEYVGLPEDWVIRNLGYLASFATILPGLFLTAGVLNSFAFLERIRCRPLRLGSRGLAWSVVIGLAFLVGPALVPAGIGHYLFAPVWLGFILLLEPLNLRFGAPSLLRDLEEGRPGRLLRLLLAGYLCGLLWEFWNYWAAAKWVYHIPFIPSVRIFEMPVLGFLGFGPFALEFYAMYNTTLLLFGRPVGGDVEAGRIAMLPAA